MNLRLTTLLIFLALLPAARASAQDDRELYHAEVCNEGRITVDVAVAYKDFDFSTDGFWIVDYWWEIPAGECTVVFSHFYAPNNLLSFQSFPLHLAFAFTDSTGTWGAAKVRPPGRIAESKVQLCVEKDKNDDKYRVDGKTPQTNCPKGVLLPASIDWEPTKGAVYQQYAGYGSPTTFTVALGANDRAIPLGARGPTAATSQGTGTIIDFGPVLGDIIDASGRSNFTWSACIAPVVVEAQSWKNPTAARLKSLRDPVIRFLSTHKAAGVRFNIIERAGIIVVEQENKSECANGMYGVN